MPELIDHRTAWRRCVWCGALQDAALATDPADPAPPDDGVVMVCSECVGVSLVDHAVEGGQRRPTADEQRSLDADPHLRRVRAAVESARELRDRRRGLA